MKICVAVVVKPISDCVPQMPWRAAVTGEFSCCITPYSGAYILYAGAHESRFRLPDSASIRKKMGKLPKM